VTNAKLNNVATSTLKGRLTAATGDPEDLTIGNGFYSSGTTISAIGVTNLLINGCFRLNQRAAATNADDTYSHDRWNILTQTGTVATSTQTLVENGTANMMRITQSPASAQRFGVEQIVEAANTYPLRGQAVTLSARVRMSATTTLRYAILEWTGTADTVTSDVVNDWTSGTFTAGNFFLGSSLTITATGNTALSANTLTSVSLSTTLGSSTNNVIVLFWTDSTQAQNVTLDVGKAQLEKGSVASEFERISIDDTYSRCLRYFFYPTVFGATGYSNSSTSAVRVTGQFPVPMRVVPTLTVSSVGFYDGGTVTSSTVATSYCTTTAMQADFTTSAGLTSGRACVVYDAGSSRWTLNAEL
jgi:hypothetical protein